MATISKCIKVRHEIQIKYCDNKISTLSQNIMLIQFICYISFFLVYNPHMQKLDIVNVKFTPLITTKHCTIKY